MTKFNTQLKLIFSIFGDDFDPNELTNYIGIKPTSQWCKGDDIYTNVKISRKRKETCWEFTEGFVQTWKFEELTKKYEKLFAEKFDNIKFFVAKRNLKLKLECIVEIADERTPSLYISKSFISILNYLNADFDFDIYILTNKDIEEYSN